MNFCSACGEKVSFLVPDGDNRPRFVCQGCQKIHYQNPKIVVGCIGEWQNKILLCHRAIEPKYGLWTLPAGFMENHETAMQGAARETMEEANAEIENIQLFAIFNITHISHVYIMFRGQVKDGYAAPGTESLATQFYAQDEIPWQQLAFPVINESLALYFEDRKNNHFKVHNGDIIRTEDNRLIVNRYDS